MNPQKRRHSLPISVAYEAKYYVADWRGYLKDGALSRLLSLDGDRTRVQNSTIANVSNSPLELFVNGDHTE